MRRLNIWWLVPAMVVLMAGAGCVTKSKANAQARAAYMQGQRQGASIQEQQNSVWMVGNVRNALIPWTADLTLVKALVAADYLGAGDPSQITLRRNGKAPVNVSPQMLLQGQGDMPLEPGDRVEIRP